MRCKRNQRRAFTYTELTMTVLIVGIVTAVSLPNGEEKSEDAFEVVANQLATDAAYARTYSTSNPDDPMVIKVDPDNNQYWLAKKSAPSTCVTHPITKKPFLRCFQPGSSVLKDMRIIGADVGTNNVMEFDSKGEIKLDRAAVVRLRCKGEEYEVSVQPAAADVKVTKLPLSAVVTEGL